MEELNWELFQKKLTTLDRRFDMKKYFMIIISVIILSSCVFDRNDNTNKIDVQPNTQSNGIARVLIPEQELIYKNEAEGYQITFPESWRGFYMVTEQRYGDVCIGFYGKSKTGQMTLETGTENEFYPFHLFNITKRGDVEGVVSKIGTIDSTEYFLLIAPSNMEILRDASDPDNSNRTGVIQHGIDELELVAQDWEKAQEMCADIDTVVKTFVQISQGTAQ